MSERVLYGAIRNPAKYAEAAQRRRTERFNGCFPRGISLGDIDSFVEINSHFLFIEWKVDDQELSNGQRIALCRLAQSPRHTVWVLWTDMEGVITHGRDMGDTTRRRRGPTDEERISTRIREWAAVVSLEKVCA